jgi:hypothetical protein
MSRKIRKITTNDGDLRSKLSGREAELSRLHGRGYANAYIEDINLVEQIIDHEVGIHT